MWKLSEYIYCHVNQSNSLEIDKRNVEGIFPTKLNTIQALIKLWLSAR